jgi:class 3 adenylate cyclase/tetratricopeptide (TPR) repeat protein
MAACSSCGTDNPERAKFCFECGSPFAPTGAARRESRRTVTVLFTDLVGSTALGERLDAEAVWEVMSRYFATMQSCIERHGGVVEKFIGDAIMAVFGLQQMHEDDALRAVRAALDMREALATLNAELHEERGVSIAVRTGINTGEVLAGDATRGQTLVTGDAVNTAARLEQAAGAGEILLGQSTVRLVSGHVVVEALPPIPAKGKTEPVPAARLVSLGKEESGRQGTSAPAAMVGRGEELDALRSAFEQSVAAATPATVIVLGSAGVGKSRLVSEFIAEAQSTATVLRGRCLSYGAGITYWPLREILHAAAGITEADAPAEAIMKLEQLVEGDPEAATIAARLGSAIGFTTEAAPGEEIFWAVRRTFERLAAERPVVAVVEDIHWAESTLLDLLQHLAEHVQAPLLLVCPARPELLERFPDWGEGRPRTQRLHLEPLADDSIGSLFDALSSALVIEPSLRRRILQTADGNPLFVEEILRMFAEGAMDAAAELAVPPTIHALMSARVDGLPPGERSVGQRAAVVGRQFEEPAVVAMTDEEARRDVAIRLEALVGRNLLAHEGSDREDAAAFKFRHILIRDAAYEGLTKAERAELHERFADWLEVTSGDRVGQYREILGYHLEQAFRYRTELRHGDERTRRLGDRAVDHLHEAARGSNRRGDVTGAVGLYRRANALRRTDADTAGLLALEFGTALIEVGEPAEGLTQAERAFEIADRTGDLALRARARILRADALQATGDLLGSDPALREAAALALADAEASADPRALAASWMARSLNTYLDGDLIASSAELDSAFDYARLLDDPVDAVDADISRVTIAIVGPQRNSEVLSLARDALDRASGLPSKRGDLVRLLALAEAMDDRAADAKAHAAEAIDAARELNLALSLIFGWFDKSWVQRMSGDYEAAEADLREAIREADRTGDRTLRGMAASRLSVVLVAQGRFDEAEPWVDEAGAIAIVTNRTRSVGARARISAHRGDRTAALAAAREVVDMVADSAFVHVKGDALVDAAETAAALGETDQAVEWLAQALAIAEAKEHRPWAAQLRRRLTELGAGPERMSQAARSGE